MSHTQPQKPARPGNRRGRVARTLLDSWPLLVWAGVLALTVWAYVRGVEFNQMDGTVAVYQEAIAPLETGRLKEVLVSVGDPVDAGEAVALMDTSLIDKEIEELKREIQADREDRIRRYRADVADLESELREYRLEQAEDQGELSALEAQLPALEEQLSRGIIRREDVAGHKLDIERLTAKLPLYGVVLDEIRTALNAAKSQLEQVLQGTAAEESAGGAMGSEERQLASLMEERANLELRAARDGHVYRVEKEAGEVIDPGEAVVRIVANPEEIVGLLPQEQLQHVHHGDTVYVASTADRHTHYPTTVKAVSPRISAVVDSASPLPNKMIFGRELILDLPKEGSFLPGQTVIINIEKPGRLPIFGQLFEKTETKNP